MKRNHTGEKLKTMAFLNIQKQNAAKLIIDIKSLNRDARRVKPSNRTRQKATA